MSVVFHEKQWIIESFIKSGVSRRKIWQVCVQSNNQEKIASVDLKENMDLWKILLPQLHLFENAASPS